MNETPQSNLVDAIERVLKLAAARTGTPNDDSQALILLTRIALECRVKGFVDEHGKVLNTDNPLFFVVYCPVGHEFDWVWFGEQSDAEEQNYEWVVEYPDDPRTVGVFPCYASNEPLENTSEDAYFEEGTVDP